MRRCGAAVGLVHVGIALRHALHRAVRPHTWLLLTIARGMETVSKRMRLGFARARIVTTTLVRKSGLNHALQDERERRFANADVLYVELAARLACETTTHAPGFLLRLTDRRADQSRIDDAGRARLIGGWSGLLAVV